MSKAELIDRIMRLNLSARKDFLEQFSVPELYAYATQLESITPPGAEEPPVFLAAVA